MPPSPSLLITATAALIVSSAGNAFAASVGGPPTFAAPVAYGQEVTGAQYVVVGDMLHRGIDDLIVTHANDSFGHVSLLLGTGQGTFGPPAQVFTGSINDEVLRAVVADVNLDAKPDLVMQTTDSAGDTFIAVALGDGKGHFTQASQTPVFAGPFLIGTFAPDRFPDVFVQAAFALPAMVLRSNGKGGFTTVQLGYGGGAGGLVAADVNHDGRLDLVGIGQSPKRYFIEQLQTLFGTGDSQLFAPPVYTPPSLLESEGTGFNSGITATAGDLRGNGATDLVVFGSDFQWGLSVAGTVYLGNPNGTFDPPLLLPILAVRAFGTSAAIADLNGDGIADIAMTTADAGLPMETYLLRGVGDGTFPVNLQTLLPLKPLIPNLVIADLNGDGRPDMVISDQTSNFGVWVLLNTTSSGRR